MTRQQHPDVTCNTAQAQYLVVFEDQYSSSTGPFGIHGQHVTASGSVSPAFAIRPVHTGETGVGTAPAAAAGEAGFLVAWEHERQGTSYLDIHGKMVWGSLFSDGFESGNTSAWSLTSP